MLFNSAPFLFVFLPVTLLGYYLILHRMGKLPSQLWLFGASVFFYGWWNPVYVILILISMGFNYALGQQLLKKRSKALLAFGLAANLLVLAYFKYMMFFLANLNWLAPIS
jgi:D-alanyl-lipoteichoic acid acyltransferase DltB (MBOAT superfamily)